MAYQRSPRAIDGVAEVCALTIPVTGDTVNRIGKGAFGTLFAPGRSGTLSNDAASLSPTRTTGSFKGEFIFEPWKDRSRAMKLHTTLTSPYGRMARIVRLEKKLADRIALEPVQTRGANNPYYAVNPSGRVPSLILDDGTILEDSTLVCWTMDHLDGDPTLHPPQGMAGLEHRRIEATARSMLDGVSLWSREYLYREAEIRSPTIMAHEQARALRLADVFEKEVLGEVLSGPLNMAQITLACVLHGRINDRPQGFRWMDGRPNLCAWVERMGDFASIRETLPPPRN